MRRILLAALALLFILPAPGPASAALRISAEGIEPFELEEVVVEDNTAWYDAQEWLLKMPGRTTYIPDDRRISWQNGDAWAAIKPQPPYAVRDGHALDDPFPPRVYKKRLVVAEEFIRHTGPELLGLDLVIERVRTGPVRRIVIDPAYGGAEAGPAGAEGVVAKDVVLAFARVLGQAFADNGYEVHLTRDDDAGPGYDTRAATANFHEADLFLSIEVRGSERPQAGGFELFYRPPPKPGEDARLWRNTTETIAGHSAKWAGFIREAMGEAVATYDRGMVELPSPLLEAVNTPAALLVAGNISWPQELSLLTDTVERKRICAALVEAADRYLLQRR